MSKNDATTQVNEVNRISSGTEFHGTINSLSDIRIDGLYEGKLTTTGRLVIGESARFVGEVIAKSCDIWGDMDGKILVKEGFGLRKSGVIKGRIACQKIFIEEGGVFNGTCKMITEDEFEENLKTQQNT
ncbi:MAG: polymer-forming cytoskeletal protein [Bacteroidales bacterium]|jgi:cytoskeletal protein CcmA (bactofilin family)|nr:polymer-forming cytoskeletal protein [Bacteroidales bacterium]